MSTYKSAGVEFWEVNLGILEKLASVMTQYELTPKRAWQTEELRGANTAAILRALTDVQEEMRRQQQKSQSNALALQRLAPSSPSPAHRRWTPRPVALASTDEDYAEHNPQESGADLSAVESKPDFQARIPRAPTGKVGPRVPDASRQRYGVRALLENAQNNWSNGPHNR